MTKGVSNGWFPGPLTSTAEFPKFQARPQGQPGPSQQEWKKPKQAKPSRLREAQHSHPFSWPQSTVCSRSNNCMNTASSSDAGVLGRHISPPGNCSPTLSYNSTLECLDANHPSASLHTANCETPHPLLNPTYLPGIHLSPYEKIRDAYTVDLSGQCRD